MKFTLKVTEKDVEIIGSALAELPFKSVASLVGKLQTQINEQQNGIGDMPTEEGSESKPKVKK